MCADVKEPTQFSVQGWQEIKTIYVHRYIHIIQIYREKRGLPLLHCISTSQRVYVFLPNHLPMEYS